MVWIGPEAIRARKVGRVADQACLFFFSFGIAVIGKMNTQRRNSQRPSPLGIAIPASVLVKVSRFPETDSRLLRKRLLRGGIHGS